LTARRVGSVHWRASAWPRARNRQSESDDTATQIDRGDNHNRTAATGTAAGAGPAVSKPHRALPCTKQALIAALRRGSGSVRQGQIDRGAFGCAKSYAFAGVIVGARAHRVEVTILFHATNGRWKIVSRTTPCEKHLVPRAIYRGACETN